MSDTNASSAVAQKYERPSDVLESQRVVWVRDFDALMAGFVLGALFVLALIGLFR